LDRFEVAGQARETFPNDGIVVGPFHMLDGNPISGYCEGTAGSLWPVEVWHRRDAATIRTQLPVSEALETVDGWKSGYILTI
jgi:hypothetical protein